MYSSGAVWHVAVHVQMGCCQAVYGGCTCWPQSENEYTLSVPLFYPQKTSTAMVGVLCLNSHAANTYTCKRAHIHTEFTKTVTKCFIWSYFISSLYNSIMHFLTYIRYNVPGINPIMSYKEIFAIFLSLLFWHVLQCLLSIIQCMHALFFPLYTRHQQ